MGRGPPWRLAGLLSGIEAALAGCLPAPACRGRIATVAAAPKSSAPRPTPARGPATGVWRRTPTDHLLAPGGALAKALAGLPRTLWPLALRSI